MRSRRSIPVSVTFRKDSKHLSCFESFCLYIFTMKTCNTCHQPKDESEFDFRSKKDKIRRTKCKSCCRDYTRTHYENNKSDYIQRAKIFSKKQFSTNRMNLWEWFQGKSCVDCGNTDRRVFEFDHKYDKSDCVSNLLQRCSWSTILKEIQKCDIRCANCHRIKTGNQLGWFKFKIDIDI